MSIAHCFNTSGFLASTWDVGLTKLWRVGGLLFAVSPDGIRKVWGVSSIDGSPIDCTIRTASSDFGSLQLKRVVQSRFTGTGVGSSAVIMDNVPYAGGEAQGQDNVRAKYPRGIRGRLVSIEARGAAPFLVSSIQVTYEMLTRGVS